MPRTDGSTTKTQASAGVSVRAPGLIVDMEPLHAEAHLATLALESMAPADDFAAQESAALEAEELTPHRSPLRLRVSQPSAVLESAAAAAAPRIATASSTAAHIELSVDADPGDHVLARVQKGKVVQWYLPILPHPVHALRAAGPGSGPVTMRFAIPAPKVPPPGPHTLEAVAAASAASDGIVSFFKFKAITDLIGGAEAKIIHFVAEKIEKRLKDEGIKGFDPQSPQFNRILSSDELKTMGSRGRMALYIHGIFSSIDGAFSAVQNDPALMPELRAKYPGGIIGYDHFTVSRRPQENAEMLLSELPPGLDLDLICHSRGGLITRAVLELDSLSKLSHLQTFRKAVFVASANQGSALAVEANWNRLLNIFIGLSSLFGGNAVGVSLDLLIGLLKVLAHGAFELPSIKDLQPGSGLIQSLNAGKDPSLEHASLVHANFDHAKSTLLKAADFAIDTVFGQEANDLVVPFPGAIAFEPTAASVSVKTIQSYNSDGTGQGNVLHTNYFSQPEVKTILREL